MLPCQQTVDFVKTIAVCHRAGFSRIEAAVQVVVNKNGCARDRRFIRVAHRVAVQIQPACTANGGCSKKHIVLDIGHVGIGANHIRQLERPQINDSSHNRILQKRIDAIKELVAIPQSRELVRKRRNQQRTEACAGHVVFCQSTHKRFDMVNVPVNCFQLSLELWVGRQFRKRIDSRQAIVQSKFIE